jgi:hypothetical protein
MHEMYSLQYSLPLVALAPSQCCADLPQADVLPGRGLITPPPAITNVHEDTEKTQGTEPRETKNVSIKKNSTCFSFLATL